LLISGGNGDTVAFQGPACALADDCTALTHDRRGYSRSVVTEPVDDDRRLTIDIEDASRLLDLVSDDPAFVFGSSSGAIIALELLLRHPKQPTKVVAHEPPLVSLLPDALHWHTFFSTVHATAASSGTAAAMAQLGAELGLNSPQRPPIETLPPHVIDMLAWQEQNSEFFLNHEMRHYPNVTINLAQLRMLRTHLVLAGGSEPHHFLPYQPNLLPSNVLVILADDPMTLPKIARAAEIDPPAATVSIKQLQARGLVHGTTHPDEHRGKLVHLSDAGRGAAQRNQTILNDPPPALTTFNSDDLGRLDEIQTRLKTNGRPL
jgi:pimeloyl-ACP methyl ester carboxylesterase